MLTITDDYTRKSWIFLTQRRNQIYDKFKAWKDAAEADSDESLRRIRCDNAKEFESLAKGYPSIHWEWPEPYTASQVGVAERLNRTIITPTRAMLFASKLPKWAWGEAANTATYTKNRTPTKGGAGKTPEELWNGQRPYLGHIRIFGCLAYCH